MWLRCGGLGALALFSLVLVAEANDKGLFICPKGRFLFQIFVSTCGQKYEILFKFSPGGIVSN